MSFIKASTNFKPFYSFCLTLLLSITNFCSFTIAKTIFVDQTGNGEHLTIQSAVNSANNKIEEPMDTIVVRPGVYSERVTIDRALNLIGSGPNLSKITKDISVDFIEKESPKEITISSLCISNQQQYSGIKVLKESLRVLIKNCIIDGCYNGIYVADQPSIFVKILNNTIINNSKNGINVSGPNNYLSSGEYNEKNFMIQGNIIAYNNLDAIIFNGPFNHDDCLSFDYNDFYDNDKTISSDSNFLDSNCKSIGNNSLKVNPFFVNIDQANYVLKRNSECVDKGLVGSSNIDPDGTRGDMGAYSGPDAVSFWPYPIDGPIVTDLSVNPVSVPKGGKITINAKGIVR